MVIDKENENVRLDRFLKNTCKNNSLGEIFKAIRKGDVKVNNKKKKQDYRLQIGDDVCISNLDFKQEEKRANTGNMKWVVYEDENYLIINKPKDVAMHKGTGNERGLAEMYNIYFANRIDKKTKGLVIGCKNKVSLRHVTELIRKREVEKTYIAKTKNNGKYVLGDKFRVELKLKTFEDKVRVDENGLLSISEFEVIDVKKENITFSVNILTGRKHQIRVQLAHLGIPIIGDDKYGNYKKSDELELVCNSIAFDDYLFKIKKP